MGEDDDEEVVTEQELREGRDHLCGGKPPISGRLVSKVKHAIISVSTGREFPEEKLKYQTTASTKETLTNRHSNGIVTCSSAVEVE